MKPIKFEGYNAEYGKSQGEYQPLPALHLEEAPGGPVIACWQMSRKERLRVLFTGKIWVQLLSFNTKETREKGEYRAITPTFVTTDHKDLFLYPHEHVEVKLTLLGRIRKLMGV